MAIKGYWRLNGNSNDASENGNNGTDTNITYSQSNGKMNQGAGFNGSSSVIQCADSTSLSLTGQYTISLWINPISLPASGGFVSLVCKYDAPTSNNSGYDFRLSNSSGTQRIGLINGNNTNSEGGDISFTLSTGVWQYIAAVYNGSQSKIYVNGNFIGQVANSVNPKDGTKLLNIGNFGYYTPTSSVLARWFNGAMDELKINSGIWGDAQIKNEYSRIKGFF